MSSETDGPWYHDGLAFECTRCGHCCTGAPGFVWVDEGEVARLAEFRGMTVPAFARRFVRQVGDRLSLIERPGGDCIFWERGTGCTVYPARPAQCQTWPFWPDNLEDADTYREATASCPGAGRGRVYGVDEIGRIAARVHTS